MDQITTEQMILIAIVGIAIFFYWTNRQRDEKGRLPDRAVTVATVNESISEFEFDLSQSKFSPPRESDFQKQLLEHFQDEFEHVQQQKPIGGVHAKQIDFDIGRDRVGVEIKMLKSLLKKSEFDRFPAQVKGYCEHYDGSGITIIGSSPNVIAVVFGTASEMKQNVKITAIKEAVQDQNIKLIFHEF